MKTLPEIFILLGSWFRVWGLPLPKIVFEFDDFEMVQKAQHSLIEELPYPLVPCKPSDQKLQGIEWDFRYVPKPKCPCCDANLKPGQMIKDLWGKPLR